MKIINTRLHGMIDYLTGAVLPLPYICMYEARDTGTLMLAAAGGLIILMAVMTDYELGMLKIIPMKVHLALDVIISAFLVATPWLPGFDHYLNWPALLGAAGILVVLMSSSVPYRVTKRDLDITKP